MKENSKNGTVTFTAKELVMIVASMKESGVTDLKYCGLRLKANGLTANQNVPNNNSNDVVPMSFPETTQVSQLNSSDESITPELAHLIEEVSLIDDPIKLEEHFSKGV